MDEDVPKVDAARTALVLMDFQPAVLGTVTESDTAALLANAETALTWAPFGRTNGRSRSRRVPGR